MRYQAKELHDMGVGIFEAVGLSHDNAEIFMDSLLQSELRGVTSHGITRLKAYSDKIRTGQIDGNAQPEILFQSPSTLSIHAHNAPGCIAGSFAMKHCIAKARESGVCFAGVRGSSHYGFGAFYAMQAAKEHMIGFSVCNADAAVVPFGGARPMLGTNPLSVAIPAGKQPWLVLDMATSVVAKGKVNLAEKLGKTIPQGWIIDQDGNPTTNPSDILHGALLPFGGPKGYAIALIIDVLCATLAGAKSSTEITSFFSGTDPKGFQDVGFFMGAIDISKFMPLEQFNARIDELFQSVKSCPPAPGFQEVMIPGEIESRRTNQQLNEGIEISDPIVQELKALAEHYGIQHPF